MQKLEEEQAAVAPKSTSVIASKARKFLTWATVLMVAVMLFTIGFKLFTFYAGPIVDEWHCNSGEAPVKTDLAGVQCMAVGTELPTGFYWDPLGNRPFNCDARRGWTPIEHETTGDLDCFKPGGARQLPNNWRLVDKQILS